MGSLGLNPYNSCAGAYPVAVCGVLLYAKAIFDNNSDQLFQLKFI